LPCPYESVSFSSICEGVPNHLWLGIILGCR
jgi:hypothetical protein